MGQPFPPLPLFVRHKVFVSYYHRDDQLYKDKFINAYSHLFIDKSVKCGDINTDVSTEYIKRLIREDHISNSSVLIVLIGPNTWGRKHVDWEISAALSAKAGGYSGLLGVLLPSFPILANGQWVGTIPWRLYDNYKSGYAPLYTLSQLCASEITVINAIESAFKSRITLASQIDNSRLQLTRNQAGV